MCGCVYVWVFLMCGCVYVWVCNVCLVICVLVFTVFCIVSFMCLFSYLFCLYCHRVTTQLQLITIIIINTKQNT
jgi:hypothetical protein